MALPNQQMKARCAPSCPWVSPEDAPKPFHPSLEALRVRCLVDRGYG